MPAGPAAAPSFDRQQAAGVVDAQFAERAVQVNHAAVDIPSIQHRQNALAHRIHDARPVERAVAEQLLAIDHHHHRGRGQGLQALARGGDGLPANRAQSGLRMHAPCALFRCARQIDVIPRPGAGSGHGRQHQGPDDAGPSIARAFIGLRPAVIQARRAGPGMPPGAACWATCLFASRFSDPLNMNGRSTPPIHQPWGRGSPCSNSRRAYSRIAAACGLRRR